MKGYFYAAATVEALHGAFPDGFELNTETGEVEPVKPLTHRSNDGVWIIPPPNNQRSPAYVVVSRRPIPALSAFLIEPEGETLA